MPEERRYCKFKFTDVWNMLANLEKQLKIQLLRGTAHGRSISLVRLDKSPHERLRAVILPRSSDWYVYRLNCWDHGLTCAVVGTHDSCLQVPCLALDTMKWYEPLKMRGLFGTLQPEYDANKKPVPDSFDKARKSHYGHNMLLGALMCGREDAIARLQSLKPSTRYRIETELIKLHTRGRGRPLEVAPDPAGGRAELSIVS